AKSRKRRSDKSNKTDKTDDFPPLTQAKSKLKLTVPSKPPASLNVSTSSATCPMTVDAATTPPESLAISSTDGALSQQSHVAGELTSTPPGANHTHCFG
ncbi:unnamed protein product, partial [Acanthoscelides obtectus]